jgi:hypothetical protein
MNQPHHSPALKVKFLSSRQASPRTMFVASAQSVAVLTLCSLCALAQAQDTPTVPVGINTQGNSGGLVIPYADVLSPGSVAASRGNYREPLFGATHDTQQDYSLGFGLTERVEFFGRFEEVSNPPIGWGVNGTRDISANVKVQLPELWYNAPKFAVGLNDISGGASFFKSGYAVATDQFGPVGVSLGYAKGKKAVSSAPNADPAFNGAFGGVNVSLGDTGLSALAEREGKQTHLGLRWASEPIAALSQARVFATVQRSTSSQPVAGLDTPAQFFNVSLVVPVGENAKRAETFQPSEAATLPPLDVRPGNKAPVMKATLLDRLDTLRKQLAELGLERVRVGQQGGALVVEYENHRYGQNELDALGLVLGLGAEAAAKDLASVYAIALKNGLPVSETSVSVDAYRDFLRDGFPTSVRSSLNWSATPSLALDQVQWSSTQPSMHSPVRVEIRPELNYTFATDLGAFDHSLAANVGLSVPLWKGAQVFTNYIMPLGHSSNMNDGAYFDVMQQHSGVRAAAVQQSFWLGPNLLSQLAAGRFFYNATGVQGDATYLIPETDDTLHWQGARYNRIPGGMVRSDTTYAATYRHMLSPSMALELGAQKYTDGTQGPSAEWTHWFGDMSVQLFFRKGGNAKFAGLQVTLPLTPRQGMKPGYAFFTGASQYAQPIRTRLTDSGNPMNLVTPGAVVPFQPETTLSTTAQLNAGRMSQAYINEQVYRLRDAFYLYSLQELKRN